MAINAENKLEIKKAKSPLNSLPQDSRPICSKFRKYLDYIFPIEKAELPKFLNLTLLMFCILCIQNLIRAKKDSVINTMIGAETISFLKLWGVLPASFLVTIIYVKLVNIMKGENIFYLIMGSFLVFFAIFAFFIYPNYEYLHLSKETANYLIAVYPHAKWFILLLSSWSFSLFYIIAELWPTAIFALLFWQFVNKITTVEESKRFYPIFGLLGQTGLVASGFFLRYLENMSYYILNKYQLYIHNNQQTELHIMSMQILISIVLILGIISLITFWLINHKILDVATAESLRFQVKKKQLTLKQSFKMIVSSKYIRLITILLVCYGFAINIAEGPWKSQVSKVYTNPTEYDAFVGSYIAKTGIITILLVIVCSNIVRRIGWFTAAVITPIIVIVTGLSYFLVANFNTVAALAMFSFSFSDPMLMAVSIGAIQNILSKSSKYTLFDSTKEMSYVPLSLELKNRGKAAADMIGTKLGKSTGAFVQSMIFIIIPSATFASISIYLMIIFTIVCLIWIWAVYELNKEYKEACSHRQGDETII